VLDSLAGILGSTEKNSVGSGGSFEGKLVEGHNFASSLKNASTSGAGESQSADPELGNLEETDVVGHGSNQDSDLVFLSPHEAGEAADRKRGAVSPAHEKALQNNSVEVGGGSSGEEAVKFDQQGKIDIIGFSILPVGVLLMLLGGNINTLWLEDWLKDAAL